MPVSISAALQKECYISSSQEEVLANLGEGWEHGVHYVLDETPSQPLANLDAAPSGQHGGRSRSESSESEEMEAHMGFTQEPVEWASPPSGPPPTEAPKEVNRTEKEDSYNAAFESDRSQSPTHSSIEEHGEKEFEGPISMGDMSVQPITQAPAGMCLSQSPTHSLNAQTGGTEIGGGCARGNRSAEPDSQPAPEIVPSQSPTQSWSPTNNGGVCQGRVWTGDMSAQPITQPPFGTQPSETQAGTQGPSLEALLHPVIFSKTSMQPSCSNRVQENETDPLQILAARGNAGLPVPALADIEVENTMNEDASPGGETKQKLMGPASGTCWQPEIENRTVLKQQPSRHVPQDRDKVDLDTRLRDIERVAIDEPRNLAKSKEVAVLEVEQACLGSPQGAQTNAVEEGDKEEGRSSQGPVLKRIASLEEWARGKMRRTDSSPRRVRIFPKTVMDVVRSRTTPLSDSVVDDSCSILSVAMRAGVSFPPFVHRKHSL